MLIAKVEYVSAVASCYRYQPVKKASVLRSASPARVKLVLRSEVASVAVRDDSVGSVVKAAEIGAGLGMGEGDLAAEEVGGDRGLEQFQTLAL